MTLESLERDLKRRTQALMAAPAWRVEFDRAAVRDLRKLGVDAERRVLRYLRERIAGSEDPRRFGHALTGDRKGLWRYRVGDYPHRCRHRGRPVRGAGGDRRPSARGLSLSGMPLVTVMAGLVPAIALRDAVPC